MREIKFRGKRIGIEEWVYGYYFYTPSTDQHQIFCPDCEGYYIVDSKTVGQFTGLKDKEGVEIYEGDIVKSETRKKCCGEVEYSETTVVTWFECGLYRECKDSSLTGWANVENEQIEIIGNVHDNPELLEGVSEPQKQSDYFPVYGDDGYEEY